VHPTSIHFVVGYARGSYKGHSRAVSYDRGAEFVFTVPPHRSSLSHDWAVIELADAIDLKPVKVRAGEMPPGFSIDQAGYRSDRPHVLSIQRDCSVRVAADPAALLVHTCKSVQGESGSALLYFGSGEPEIVGVLTAVPRKRNLETADASFGVPASAFGAAVEKALR
jgi:protease YdgD